MNVAPGDAQQTLQKIEIEHQTSRHSCLACICLGLARSCSFCTGVSCGGTKWSAACLNATGLMEHPYSIPEIPDRK